MLSLTIKSQYSKKPQFIAVWSILLFVGSIEWGINFGPPDVMATGFSGVRGKDSGGHHF